MLVGAPVGYSSSGNLNRIAVLRMLDLKCKGRRRTRLRPWRRILPIGPGLWTAVLIERQQGEDLPDHRQLLDRPHDLQFAAAIRAMLKFELNHLIARRQAQFMH